MAAAEPQNIGGEQAGDLASPPEITQPESRRVSSTLHFPSLPPPCLLGQWKTQPPTHQGLISPNELGNGNQMLGVDRHQRAGGSWTAQHAHPPVPRQGKGTFPGEAEQSTQDVSSKVHAGVVGWPPPGPKNWVLTTSLQGCQRG